MTDATALQRETFSAWADPETFAREVLRDPPREVQPEILAAVRDHPRVAVKSCRGAGKTWTGAAVALWYLVTRPNCAVVVVAPVYSQLASFWTTLRAIWFASKLPKLFPSWEILETFRLRTDVPGWQIIGLSAESGEAVEGIHGSTGILLVLDEAKKLTAPVVASLMQMTGGHEDAKVLAISTPGPARGPFYKMFVDPGWKTFTFSAKDIPRLQRHYEEQRRELGGDSSFFKQQLEGEFADSDDGEAVLTFDRVRACVRPPLESVGQPGILGFDPAGRGRDFSIAAHRKGPNVLSIHALGQSQDEMETVGRVIQLAEKLRVQMIVVDVAGLGGPMESRLREVFSDPSRRRVEVAPFNGGWRPRDPETYLNAKTELLFQVRARINSPEPDITLPDDPLLIAQLCAYTLTTTSSGRTRVVDPMPSPDRADAVLLTFFRDPNSDPSIAFANPGWLGYC